MSLTVTIGRNINSSGYPLDDSAWEDFKDAIEHVLFKVYKPATYFKGEGSGWSEQWGQEDAWTIIVSEPQYGDIRERLYVALSLCGRAYGQQAVAVTEGRTEFV